MALVFCHKPNRIHRDQLRMTSIGTQKTTHHTLGIEVSKDRLVVHRLADRADRRFANSNNG